ncbi:hypothetical protein A3I27_04395 [Candidatus Giovannonibacteria bacterium RIFCSPLOWO2_02_FULL_43_11b]|uniref:Uncharacterized protein n=1 Tax=Candidatus Giovannonibacteria bacterium RIFCSPHIGHO2_12_FULL_43_15 TaxID=1798341 RepID=A0A1F5WPH9_9BACT|nr:MAG: hypothetical protein A2739_00755 [Candidatus Giovannonibacteria bacterium RIFCSPHIGHO2_01_FULL_43_100]OGF66728.1 MAG: hypothetical protein A3B97_02335 [Candidatus Giovannonibacteria bacterium RIFCSPHIGHO2_02_FULL_43_32]OGF77504.1 MAG: hypothetical protein A3F23_00830 [Candidatus Giovannonibacteria bacterium RIFCSPHIGHO2_12_FULL_43_15]OGF78875.1 MAG: hypothetical protein A3A15_00230 [Candidatus Giovannonibacteria bacterium RIFCSPLOWO2_01_FULL_43_60]OGF89948.1 MAG: hypothetical protein A3
MKIFLGILFLIFITWGGWYVYKNFLFPEPSKPVDEDVPKKLINAQERIIRLESNSEISKDINDIKKLPNDSFEVIFFSADNEGARHFLTPMEFFLAGEMHPPQVLLSSVINYNFGLVGGETKNYPFLILDIESAEEARAGITEWEKNMPKELSGIFADLENMKTEGKDSFHDQVIKNQTARIFESSGNKIVYTFYNQRLLIIAPSVEAFSAIISRYAVFPPN